MSTIFQKYKLVVMIAITGLLCLTSLDLLAYVAPKAGSSGYGFYDTIVNTMLKGPVGTAIGVVGYAFAAGYAMVSNWKVMAGAAIGSTLLLQAPTIATSFGVSILVLL